MRILLTIVIVMAFVIYGVTTATLHNVIATIEKNQSMGVIVDGKTYALQAAKDIPVLHTGSAPSGSSYSYAKLDGNTAIVEKEPFQRHNPKLKRTPNEFYNRTWNTQPSLFELPNLLDPLPCIHRKDSEIHTPNQIPTIHLTADPSQIDHMHGNTNINTKVQADMHFIKTDQMITIKGIELKLAGHASRWTDKLSYNIKTPKHQLLFGYRRVKLRALRKDPSYMREILCHDMMRAMGLPGAHASYIRLIINDQPLGLFLMVEPFKNTWYQNEFANGHGDQGHGATYQGFVGSSLEYLGNNISAYKTTYQVESKASGSKKKKSGGGGDKTVTDYQPVIDFTKFLAEAPTTAANASIIWNKHIDMESVIRSVVIEIIGGFSDGYLGFSNNFFLYDNWQEDRLTYLQADFDTTLGNTWFRMADLWSGNYTRYPGFTLRPLTQKMMQVPTFKARFELLLSQAARELIHTSVIRPRIDALVMLLREDVIWDTSLPKVNPHPRNDKFTGYEDIPDHFKNHEPPVDLDVYVDYHTRLTNHNPDFDSAVYQPFSDHISLAGITQWFDMQSNALQTYFAQYPPSL